METTNFSLNQYPYELPIMGFGIIIVILLFFTLNYIIFKTIGFLMKINTSTGNDPSKIVYLFSFIITSIIVFLIIYPYLRNLNLIN